MKKLLQPHTGSGLKALEAALALVALESPKLPNAALPQDLLSPAKKSIFKLIGYKAELIDYQYGFNAVAIKHKFSAKGKRVDGSDFSYSKIALDVLELENGKVSVIRRYSQ